MSFAGIAAAGLGGGANAVGSITAGLIDQDRRLESARVLADIDTQRQMRLAEYAQKMGRENQTYNTTGAGGAELLAHEKAKGEQAQGIVLAGRKAEAIDPEITAGLAGRAGAVAKATGDVQTEQDIKRATAMLPLEIKRAYALADASGRASAAHREKAPTMAGKVAEIESAIGRVLTEEEKLGVLGLAKSQATDKVTTIDTVEDINTGRKSERKVESTVPRGAGIAAGPGGGAPPEGSTIYDKQTGEKFVVKNGVPVPVEKPPKLTESEAGAMRSAEQASAGVAVEAVRREAVARFEAIKAEGAAGAAREMLSSKEFNALTAGQRNELRRIAAGAR